MLQLKFEAKSILTLLEEIKKTCDLNKKSNCIVTLGKSIITKNIIPFLDIKDLLNFRASCKELNDSVNSPLTIISLLKNYKDKTPHQAKPKSSNELKSFNEINDVDDIQEQMQNLKNINEFLAKRIFKSESFIKVCKTDIDFLKKQLVSQQQLTSTLSESLNSTRLELEKCKQENEILTTNYNDANKKLLESTSSLKNENEALILKNDKLCYEVETLKHTIYKLNKTKEEISLKNTEKAKALKSIRNFFLSSNLFKIKNISDFEKELEERSKE